MRATSIDRKRRLLLAGGVALPLAGCDGPREMDGPDAPAFDAALTAPRRRPSLAVVFGAGGPRGFAHVGVVKVLERSGIVPELIVGSSIGAVIGALWAAGMKAPEIEKLALDIGVAQFVTYRWGAGMTGNGNRIEDMVGDLVHGRRIETLPTRVAIVAARRDTRAPIAFNRGDIAVAARASSAIPGTFLPVRINGVEYIDGDEYSPVPAGLTRTLGADMVVAIDVSAHASSIPANAPAVWAERDRLRARQSETEKRAADIFIHPDLGYYASVRYEYRLRSIAIAERETERVLPALRALIAARAG